MSKYYILPDMYSIFLLSCLLLLLLNILGYTVFGQVQL